MVEITPFRKFCRKIAAACYLIYLSVCTMRYYINISLTIHLIKLIPTVKYFSSPIDILIQE